MSRRRIGSFWALVYTGFFVAILCLITIGLVIDEVLSGRDEFWGGILPVGLCAAAGVLILRRCAYAATDGRNLFLTTVRGADEVPLEAVAKVVAHSKGWRYLEVHLDPPARLGRRFWIPVSQDFSGAALWDGYEFLAEYAHAASHDRSGAASPRAASRRQAYPILGIWAAIVVGIALSWWVDS